MILVDNIVFMKERFPMIWEAYRVNENKQNQSLVEIQPSKVENYPTLCVKKEDRSYYIHSRYNPEREVTAIIDNYNGDNYEHVIFYGVGLGYHITSFLEKYPHLTFSIYEPVPEVFKCFLSHFDLKELPQRRLHEIVVETSQDDAKDFLERTIKQIPKNTLFLDLPSYRNIFPEKHSMFLNLFKDIVINRRSSLITDYVFEKRWILNSLLNFKHVLNTPNIIAERKGAFKDKPAILVAAGPSLDYEIENLRYIKENGLAYIFSVGSAVNALLGADIYPDATCAYDPSERNQKVFKKLVDENITDIPLIFGSSIAHENLTNYPGQCKLHMVTSQDTISSYLLKLENDNQLDAVMDAPSIAVVTLQLLYKLGFNPIILVGQNLAFGDKKLYADNIAYWQNATIDSESLENLMIVEDVEGREIYTKSNFYRMKLIMENYIKEMKDIKVINTTRGGANIEGTEFKYLDDLIRNKVLADNVVTPDWCDISPTNYNGDYLQRQFNKLIKDYEILDEELMSLLKVLEEISRLKEVRNIKQLQQSWVRLDKAFNRVQNNSFFDKIIRPMNRVNYELLIHQMPLIRFEADQIRKAELIVELYTRVNMAFLADLQTVKQLMQEFNVFIQNQF